MLFFPNKVAYVKCRIGSHHTSSWLKGALSGLRKFLTVESPLKMMKNVFYFTSKTQNDENAFYFTSEALFVLEIFTFLSWPFGHVAKRLDNKVKVNFNFYDVTP